jgi:hypothetical protein
LEQLFLQLSFCLHDEYISFFNSVRLNLKEHVVLNVSSDRLFVVAEVEVGIDIREVKFCIRKELIDRLPILARDVASRIALKHGDL